MINLERKKDQINLVAYETFEIIIDRLEKEYFDLVRRISRALVASRHPFTTSRPRTSPNLTTPCPRRTRPVLYAMIRKERIAMRSCSVMGVTWPYIKVCGQAPRLAECSQRSRLLRRSLHTRGTVALSKVYRVSREPSGERGRCSTV